MTNHTRVLYFSSYNHLTNLLTYLYKIQKSVEHFANRDIKYVWYLRFTKKKKNRTWIKRHALQKLHFYVLLFDLVSTFLLIFQYCH